MQNGPEQTQLDRFNYTQTIGCVGAIKLSERYLNIYLLTIVILLFGDGILGIVWILRYNSIITNLRFDLKQQLNLNYKSDLYLQVRVRSSEPTNDECMHAPHRNYGTTCKPIPSAAVWTDRPTLSTPVGWQTRRPRPTTGT